MTLPWLQRHRAVRGIAWAPAWTVPYLRDDFGATLFFHSQTTQARWWPQGGVPVVRSAEHQRAGKYGWVRHLAALVDAGYQGPVIFGNEPDRPDQDAATPESMAGQYLAAAAWLSRVFPSMVPGGHRRGIQLIAGNAISQAWTAEFVRHIGHLRPGDALGVHIYEDARLPSDERWQWPGERLRRLAAAVGDVGQMWVTEYGVERAWPVDVVRRYVEEIETHPRVSHAFAFTSHPGTDQGHAGRFGLYADGSMKLTTAGEVFKTYQPKRTE